MYHSLICLLYFRLYTMYYFSATLSILVPTSDELDCASLDSFLNFFLLMSHQNFLSTVANFGFFNASLLFSPSVFSHFSGILGRRWDRCHQFAILDVNPETLNWGITLLSRKFRNHILQCIKCFQAWHYFNVPNYTVF